MTESMREVLSPPLGRDDIPCRLVDLSSVDYLGRVSVDELSERSTLRCLNRLENLLRSSVPWPFAHLSFFPSDVLIRQHRASKVALLSTVC